MLPVFPPFLFMRYLFCHILAMKTVAMENAQRSQDERTQLIPTITGFHQMIAIFKETMQTDKGGAGRKHYKLTKISNHQWGDLRLIIKRAEKILFSRDVSLLSPWHNQRGWGGFCEVNTLRTNWAQFKGRRLRLCRQSIYFYPVSTSKPSGLGCSIQPRHFNKKKWSLR